VVNHVGTICPILDARKGELYAASFESNGTELRRRMPDVLVTPESLLATLPAPCVVLGDAVERYGALFHDRLGAAATILPFPTHGPRGGVVATLGWELLHAGHAVEPHQLEPFYIRPSEAEVNAIRN
jgi:tRNA threonylcarbamoyladenosine biosynthesis protein TsaB